MMEPNNVVIVFFMAKAIHTVTFFSHISIVIKILAPLTPVHFHLFSAPLHISSLGSHFKRSTNIFLNISRLSCATERESPFIVSSVQLEVCVMVESFVSEARRQVCSRQ